MTYRLEITRRAQQDRETCFDFIFARSPAGALHWLDAFETAADSLLKEDLYGEAPESIEHQETIRQKVFRTRHGRTYRLLYVVRAKTIYIIHVRGAGQDVMTSGQIDFPGD